jgi:cellulose synthase/poly-beta-1,6-N-acetylglucosamine synthase-like glycosyltransferase
MIHGKKIVVVLPAYNAARTLKQTFEEIPMDLVDEVVLVDDASSDNTADLAHEIGIKHVVEHKENKGRAASREPDFGPLVSGSVPGQPAVDAGDLLGVGGADRDVGDNRRPEGGCQAHQGAR